MHEYRHWLQGHKGTYPTNLIFGPKSDLCALRHTPITVARLHDLLRKYPKKADGAILSGGFQFGFSLQSLTYSLQFCAKAMPSARVFI